jgi:O-antigen ligase
MKKTLSLEKIETILLAALLILLPFFLGLSSNTGIMIWQLITFLLVNVRLIRAVFIENKILRPGIYEIILVSVVLLSVFHFFLSSNRYNSFLMLTNILFFVLFAIFYLRYLSKDEFIKSGIFFLMGFIIQLLVGSIQFIINPSEPIRGGFLDPNYFAVYLVICGLIILGACLFNLIPKSFKSIGYFFTFITFLLVIATQSRSATGLYVIFITFLLFLKRPRYSFIGVFIIIFLILVPNPYKTKIEEVHKTDPYAYTRLNIYQMDLEIFTDYFLFGTGLGCFTDYSPAYNFPVESVPGRYRVVPEQAHNSYLQWIIETGTPGLIMMFMFFSMVFLKVFYNLLKTGRKQILDNRFNPGADVALLSLAVIGILHNVFQNSTLFIIFLFLVTYSDIFARDILNKKNYYFKLNLSSKEKEIRWIYLVWITLFMAIWYFLIHSSWLSTVYLNRSVEDIKRKDFQSSLENIRKSTKIIPFYTKAILYYADINALIFTKTDNLDYGFSALQLYDRGLQYSYRNDDMQMNRIRLLINMHDIIKRKNPKLVLPDLEDEIESSFSNIFRTHPKKIFHYHDYAVYKWNDGKLDSARNALEHSLKLEPNYISAHLLLAVLYEKTGDLESSQRHRELAKDISKKYDFKEYKNDYYLYNLLKWN